MNKKKDVFNFLNKYSEKEVEVALVKLFTERFKITVNNNKFILSILKKYNKSLEGLKNELNIIISENIFFDFVNIFEMLVPEKDKRINGSFFTPKEITSYICSSLITGENQKICDPSCGCGSFLITAAEYINNKYGKSFLKIIENNIYGVDISDYSLNRAKILLSLLALKNGEDFSVSYFNLRTADSLTLDWDKEFKVKFDVVLGNPPYVKFQDLNDSLRKSLKNKWETVNNGNYNLYFPFFELGFNLLNKDGSLGFITPNNYFTSLSAISLRQFFSKNKNITKIVDFGHLKVFNAQTYTCISFLNKRNNYVIEYAKVPNISFLKNKKIIFSKISIGDLQDKKWRLVEDSDKNNIKKIENMEFSLGGLFDIKNGIATCRDSVYFIEGDTLDNNYYYKEYKGILYKIEKDCVRDIIKISDFKDNNELKNNSRKIIFPYSTDNNGFNEIIKEKEFKMQFPFCYKYLLSAKQELLMRDKGKKKYPEWYAYARNQGLNIKGKKLLTPTFSDTPRFMLENDKNTLFCNGYAVIEKKNSDLFVENKLSLKALSSILNSNIMDYYIKNTSVSIEGGYPCYQKNFIELLGIPKFNNDEIFFLEKTKDKHEIEKFLEKKYNIKL